MHADIEKAVVEGNGEDRWPPVLGDDRQPPVLGVPEQFAGTLPQPRKGTSLLWANTVAEKMASVFRTI